MLESTLVRTFPAYQNIPWYPPVSGASSGGGGGPTNPVVTDEGDYGVTDEGDIGVYEEVP